MRETTNATGSEAHLDSTTAATAEIADISLSGDAAKLQATFEALTDGVIVFDAAGRLIQMNPAARTLLMLDEDMGDYALPTGGSSRFVVRDEQGHSMDVADWPITRVMRGEVLSGANAVDVRIRSLDGQERQVSVTGAPVRGPNGKRLGAVCIMHDVTERRRLEQRTRDALAALLVMAEAAVTVPSQSSLAPGAPADHASAAATELAELARQVVGCARVAITGLDEKDKLVPVAIVGISQEEARQWHALLSGVPLALFLPAELVVRLRAGNVFTVDTTPSPRREAAFGTTVALLAPMRIGNRLTGILSLDSGAPDHLYSADDEALAAAIAQLAGLVMDRDRLLRERAEAQSRALALEAANHLMSEFLGIAGHELRTPLTSIRASAQLALRTLRGESRKDAPAAAANPDPAATLAHLQPLIIRIEQQSHRQERLVNDLLDVSRIEAGRLEFHPEDTDLAALVRDCVEEHRLLHPSRAIVLSLPARAASVPVYADADRVGQVLSNYLSNALKYSPDTSPVTVSLRTGGSHARVSVRDAGPGLPLDEQARVWERFYRSPSVEVRSGSGIGLGLGLFLCKTIVERHGGNVGVTSTPGRGSTFWLTLPLAV